MSNDLWQTPPELYDPLFIEFDFQFDLCADKANAKCMYWSDNILETATSIIKDESPLFFDYRSLESFWVNPPYSRGNIDECMSAVKSLNNFGKKLVSLTRFDPTANWFKNNVDGVASEVRMLDKRVKFVGAKDSYNFPCCISIFRGFTPKSTHYYSWGWT